MCREQPSLYYIYRSLLVRFTDSRCVSCLTVARSNDGLTLFMTSTDGFCSCLSFSPGELGQAYEGKVPATPTARMASINTSQMSANPTPNITPITPIGPTLPRQQSITSAFSNARPASPARSMSTASSVGPFAVPNSAPSAENPTAPLGALNSTSAPPGSGPASGAATPNHNSQSSAGAILMHPTPSLQNVPSVAAAHSGPVPSNVPTWMTPPETPIPPPPSAGRTHSASSSVSGFKADGSDIVRPSTEVDLSTIIEDVSIKAKRATENEAASERPEKKRRIEPTLVSAPEKD
jgi:chromatin assembly factor 1 subunit B